MKHHPIAAGKAIVQQYVNKQTNKLRDSNIKQETWMLSMNGSSSVHVQIETLFEKLGKKVCKVFLS